MHKHKHIFHLLEDDSSAEVKRLHDKIIESLNKIPRKHLYTFMSWVEKHEELNIDPHTKFVLQTWFDYGTKQFEQILQSGRMMLNDVRVATDVEKKIADIVKLGNEFIDRIVNVKLTPEEKKYVAELIHVFRKLKHSKDPSSYLDQKMYDLNYQIGTLFDVLPGALVEFNDQHVKDVERKFIILRELNGLTFEQIDKFLKEFVPLLEKSPFTDQKFQSTMKSVVKLLDKIKPYPKVVIHHEFNDSLGSAWIHILQTLRNSGTTALKDKFDAYMIYKMWNRLSETEQDEILGKISDGIDDIVDSADKLNKRLRNNVNPEASKDDSFEEFAFAEERYGQVPNEPDNELEKRLYNALVNHFNENVALNPDDAKQLQKVLKSKKYSSVIHGPTQDMIYRGMAVPEQWIKTALKLKKKDKLPLLGRMETSFTFKPRPGLGATSWTTQQETAINFASDSAENYMIVMVAEVANNDDKFIMGDDGLYRVGDLNLHADEHEVVALGSIKVSKIVWKKSDSEEDFPTI